MSENPARLAVWRANSACPACFFSMYGAMLVEVWAIRVGAGISTQAFFALIGFAFAATAYFRYRRAPRLPAESQTAQRQQPIWMLTIGNVVWSVLMFAVGGIFAHLALAGWITPMFIFAIGLHFLPWSRASACRRDFVASGVLIAAGAAYPLLASDGWASPMGLLIAGWVLWMNALVAFLRGMNG